jgi:hypothetical protein
VKPLAALITLGAAVIAWLGLDHPYGLRFAVGIWPVPAGTPWSYQLESGFIPALTVLTLLSLVSGAWQHVNCHHRWCLRTGKHKVNGTPWCDRHHGDVRPERTENEILLSVEAALTEMLTLLKAQAGEPQ